MLTHYRVLANLPKNLPKTSDMPTSASPQPVAYFNLHIKSAADLAAHLAPVEPLLQEKDITLAEKISMTPGRGYAKFDIPIRSSSVSSRHAVPDLASRAGVRILKLRLIRFTTTRAARSFW